MVEIAGIGPAPHACMLMSDLGADVIRVDRPGARSFGGGSNDLLSRGRLSAALDLKQPEAIKAVLQLVERADVLVEGMRPGVAERLGLGPDDCFAVNERLVYGRMTGWGQDGPLAYAAGHDINYVAVSGVLDGLGQDPHRPHFPGNLLGDFGAGSTYLVIGVLAALREAAESGRGQVVDAAIVDGATSLNAIAYGMLGSGHWGNGRGSNVLNGGAPFYDLYQTADGRHMAVGALEPQFFSLLIDLLGVKERCPGQYDTDRYDEMRSLFEAKFQEKTQAQWTEVFKGTDACVAEVMSLEEAPNHPHLRARNVFVEHFGTVQPAPAPRFSRTPGALTVPPPEAGEHTKEALAAWGVGNVADLIDQGAAVQARISPLRRDARPGSGAAVDIV